MPTLSVSPDLDPDLDALSATHSADVGLIDALIEELAGNDVVLATLSQDVPKWGHGTNAPFEIKRFHEAWNAGRRIYVLKPYDEDGQLIGFRVFIGHDVVTDEYFALSVQPRATCYDITTPEYRQLCKRYDDLDIPSAM